MNHIKNEPKCNLKKDTGNVLCANFEFARKLNKPYVQNYLIYDSYIIK